MYSLSYEWKEKVVGGRKNTARFFNFNFPFSGEVPRKSGFSGYSTFVNFR